MRLEINGRDAGIKFSACHFIPGHDKCGRLHGHAYVISLVVHGERSQRGMIMDFLTLKKSLREIAEKLDHHVLIPGNSPHLKIEFGEGVTVQAEGKRYVFPIDDVVILDSEESSAEELARIILSMLLEKIDFPNNVRSLELGVEEELGQSAWEIMQLRC
ncbi:MAG: 6-pyruvoyl tetrahydropterin synthase family protein [Methanomassiliicoccales archaeon]